MKLSIAAASAAHTNNIGQRIGGRIAFAGFFFLAIFLRMFPVYADRDSTLVQISTISALLQGVYDGDVQVDDLRDLGDFGLGTFNGLDGEMIVWHGRFYRADVDGRVSEAEGFLKVPFAELTKFNDRESFSLPAKTTSDEVRRYLDSLLPSKNYFYAIEIRGTFTELTTRSVPRQTPPYPVMTQVIRDHQQIRKFAGVQGTLIGFRTPGFMKGLGIPGYHFHFLDETRQLGGHVLEFVIDSGRATIDQIERFDMRLAHTPEFFTADLNGDFLDSLELVEQRKETVRPRSRKEN